MSTSWRGAWRRLSMGLATVSGVGRQGWFIPYRYAGQLPAAGANPSYDAIETLLRGQADAMLALLADAERYGEIFTAIDGDSAPGAPRWNQGWFAPLDAAIAYAVVRAARPKLIVEVGSGHSTRFIARAVEDGALTAKIVAIDPAPRAVIAHLAPLVELRPRSVHGEALDQFDALEAGDILFIDSSHILMPGSDVDYLFNRALPRLARGVLVHIHDIFLPDDYPAAWAWRGYNEQLAAAPLLTGGAWRARFASHFVSTRFAQRLQSSAIARLPRHPQAIASSLWLEKT